MRTVDVFGMLRRPSLGQSWNPQPLPGQWNGGGGNMPQSFPTANPPPSPSVLPQYTSPTSNPDQLNNPPPPPPPSAPAPAPMFIPPAQQAPGQPPPAAPTPAPTPLPAQAPPSPDQVQCVTPPYRWHPSLPPGLRPVRMADGTVACLQFMWCSQGGQSWQSVYLAQCDPSVVALMGSVPPANPSQCTPSDGTWLVWAPDGTRKCYQAFLCTDGQNQWEILNEIACPAGVLPASPPGPVATGTGAPLTPTSSDQAPVPASAVPAGPAAPPAATAGPSISPAVVAGGVGVAGIATLIATGVIKLKF